MSETDQRLRRLRRTPILDSSDYPRNPAESDGLLERLLPHRPPMLLVDELVGRDLEDELVVGRRRIGDDHIGLRGHFPGDPVLPGTLQLEMLGQLGVALFSMLLEEQTDGEVPGVRATKIRGAHFVREVRPGDTIDLVVRAGEWDTFLGECEAQAVVDGDVAAAMVGEVAITG